MSEKSVIARRTGVHASIVSGCAAFVMGLGLVAGSAMAQPAPEGGAAPAAKAPPAGKEAPKGGEAKDAKDAKGDDKSKIAWVKLCEKNVETKKDKDGKELKEEKNVCVTMHDRIDANSGTSIVTVRYRDIEGKDTPDLLVTVPLGMLLRANMRVAILSKEEAEKIVKQEQVDPKTFKQAELKFGTCLPNGCTAEGDVTKELAEQIKAADTLLVSSIVVNGQPYTVPVPMKGFAETHAGKPVDSSEYNKARASMMKQLRERQVAAQEKAKAEQMKLLPPQPGAEGAAAPAGKAADGKKEATK